MTMLLCNVFGDWFDCRAKLSLDTRAFATRNDCCIIAAFASLTVSKFQKAAS